MMDSVALELTQEIFPFRVVAFGIEAAGDAVQIDVFGGEVAFAWGGELCVDASQMYSCAAYR